MDSEFDSQVSEALVSSYAKARTQVAGGSLFQTFATIHQKACWGSDDVHSPDLFFAWHRAFLYFHEQALVSAGGKALSLPYWDASALDEFPCVYEEENLQAYREFKHKHKPCADWQKPLQFLSTAQTTEELYTKLSQWHFWIHGWVGGQMGTFQLAAYDPIFYAWHANVDRAWAASGLDRKQKLQAWAPFWRLFPGDSAGKWVYADLGQFCRGTERLGYCYAKPMDKPAPVDSYFEFRNLTLAADTRYHIVLQDGAKTTTVQTVLGMGGTSEHVHPETAYYWTNDASIAARIDSKQAKFVLLPLDASPPNLRDALPLTEVTYRRGAAASKLPPN